MPPFLRLQWPEMRPLAHELIARMREGHAHRRFTIPVVDFVRVFAPGAEESELAKVAERGEIHFTADADQGGTFQLAEGLRATFELGREGLVMRVPERMSGHYEIRPAAFHIDFQSGEELEGCKHVLMLVCNRVLSVDVSSERVDVHLPSKLFDLCVEFQ